MASNFDKVGEFHQTFGHPITQKVPENLFEGPLVNFRISLIEEELNELKEASAQKNLEEVADALCDILYVTYGAGQAFGLNLDAMFAHVHECNMSKVCSTQKEAEDTVKHYQNLYKQNKSTYSDPRYRKEKDYFVVYDHATSKILKNIHWKKPNVASFLNL